MELSEVWAREPADGLALSPRGTLHPALRQQLRLS